LALTRRARALPWIASGMVLALFVVVGHTPLFSPWIRAWLLREAPRRADAIVVLSSDVTESGHLNANGLTRYVAALALARDGYAPLLIRTDLPETRPDESDDARALAAGVDVELVLVGPVASTRDEALRARALMRERGLRSAIVVTQPLHERRAAATFRAAGIDVVAVPAPERAYSIPELPEAEDRVRAFSDWIAERAAWTLYSMRGWLREANDGEDS
ncbi:MAG: YdcF family protein, partial [Myxococcota bacterium]|nr:YdcF family protein [Myxococcota bacterium]